MIATCGKIAANAQMKTDYYIPPRPLRIRDMPERLRPREEVARAGVGNVGDDVLLAVLLRTGVPGINVMTLAQDLCRRYGALAEMAKASTEELALIPGMGKVKAQILKSALELARRLAAEKIPVGHYVRTPADAAALLREQVQAMAEEHFWVLNLNAKNRLQAMPCEVSHGILDASLVHPREIFRRAIQSACAAVILVHNHPSGDPTPSAEDLRITRQLVAAGKVVGIEVLDHVILGHPQEGRENDFISLRESGMVQFGSEG